MTLYPRPQVDISFRADVPLEEPPPQQTFEPWANTPGRRIFQAVLLCALCIAAFAPSIYGAELLPGDESAVAKNPILYQWSGLKDVWGKPQRLPQLTPFSYTVFLLEHQSFAFKPRGYRIMSLMMHMTNALLLLHLLRKLELPGAWLGAALFAVHPVQVDAVSWISQQRYLLCGFFYLSALIVYLRRAGLNPTPPPPLPGTGPMLNIGLPESPMLLYAAALGLFILALASHLVGGTFPLVVLIMIWWERGTITRDDLLPLLPFGVLGLGMATVTAIVFYHTHHLLWEHSVGIYWPLYIGKGAFFYALKLLLPFGNSFAYPRWIPESTPLWQWVIPLAAIFVVIALASLRKRFGRGPLASALLFMALLIPAAFGINDTGSQPNVLVADHMLYLACAALLVPLSALIVEWIITSKALSKLVALPGLLPAASILTVAPLAAVASMHSLVYREPISLWENALHGDGDSAVALNTLGTLELDKKEYGKAEGHFQAALRADPNDPAALLHLAHAAELQGDYDTAIQRYYQILNPHPDNVDAHFGLAASFAAQGNTSGAYREYDIVKKIDPRNALVYNNIGLLMAEHGDFPGAIEQYKKAIELDPRGLAAYINMANVQFQQGKSATDPDTRKNYWQSAADTLKKVLEIDPRNYIAFMNAGAMAAGVQDFQSAEKYFRIAIYIKYDGAEAFNDLGMILLKEPDPPGKMDHVGEALYCFKRAAELNPGDAGIQANLQVAQRRRDRFLALQQQH